MRNKKYLFQGFGILALFAIWTALVCLVDVQPIGPQASCVGLAVLNGFFHQLTGVHMHLYVITDWLGLVPFAIVAGFGIFGLIQWIQRRSLRKVDYNILMLGAFYILVFICYLLFEKVVVNYRPVLIEGMLEVSYPSSTTMLTMSVMLSTHIQLRIRIRRCLLYRICSLILAAFTLFMIAGRTLSGVHWLTDIIGGILLSFGLVRLYQSFCE